MTNLFHSRDERKLKNIHINTYNIAHQQNEEKSHKIFSGKTEKAFDKIQLCCILKDRIKRAREMVQPLRELTPFPENLSSIPTLIW